MLKRSVAIVALAGGLLALASSPASAQWVVESKDGETNVKLGFLLQGQGEWLETPDGEHTSQNLFLRRMRLILGGKLGKNWTFFIETDSPNLGKANPDKTANPTGAKDAGDAFIQDAFVTYSHSDAFKVDAGMLMTPLSHQHQQSAISLLAVDYNPYAFVESGPLGARVGRDYGLSLRGYPAKQHLEYRLGVYQGLRGPQSRNALRFAGRAVFYPWAADTGFFYAGTFQGSKKLLGIGASFDVQKDFRAFGGDVFYELPIKGGQHGLTFQGGWTRLDGGDFIASLPEQDTYLVEAAFHLKKGRFSPFVQYARRDFSSERTADQDSFQGGLAWWLKGHSRSLKASAGRLHTDGQPDRLQVLVQLQTSAF